MAQFEIVTAEDEYALLAANAVPTESRVSYDQVANSYNITEVKGSPLKVSIDKKHAGKVASELTKRGLNRNTDFTVVGVTGSKGDAVMISRLTDARAFNTPRTRTAKPVSAPPIPADAE